MSIVMNVIITKHLVLPFRKTLRKHIEFLEGFLFVLLCLLIFFNCKLFWFSHKLCAPFVLGMQLVCDNLFVVS